jgi:hypothetical protein
MNEIGSLEVMLTEGALISIAIHTVEAEADRTREKLLHNLLNETRSNIRVVSELEGTTDPIKVARELLRFTVMGARLLMEVPPEKIDPFDKYSKQLQTRRKNLPHVLQMFDSIVGDND